MGDFALRLCENIRVGLNFFWPVYIVCAKCQKALVNTLVQADSLCMHYLSTIKFKFKSKQEKWLSSQSCHLVKK